MGCNSVYVRNAALVAPGRRPRTQLEAPRRIDRLLDRKFCTVHRCVTSSRPFDFRFASGNREIRTLCGNLGEGSLVMDIVRK